MDGKIGEL